MKQILLLTLIASLSAVMVSCNQTAKQKESKAEKETTSVENTENTEIQAYYFHATRRCATCNAVEKVTKESIKNLYGDKVSFASINREEDADNPLISKHKISGQTLLIIKGDNVVDLTTVAFMNARNSPEKLTAEIKAAIDALM